jgi:fibronectin type 3 domain-containing protein
METGNTNLKSLTVREWDPVVSLPGRVTVDAYVAYNDLTAGNSGGACRQDNVDMQVSSDIGGGCQISSTQAGEWVEYSTKFAEAGWYEFSLRLASYYAARTAKVFVDGSAVGTFTAPANGWQVFSSVVSAPIAVNAGTHTIRIQFVTGNTNTHYLDVTKLTGLPPQVVSGLAAVADNGFVDLTWNASIGATSYKVVRGTDTVATVTGTAYHDASVVNGTTYTYSVVGANSFGNAAASNSVTATPKVPEAPVGPTNLVAVAGDARVDLTWAAVSGATSYNVYRSIDGIAFAKVAGVANAQHLDATVLNGTTYSYYVTAMNESIRGVPESKPSDTVEATPRGSAPAKVTGLVATGDDSKVVLDWTPSVGANAYTIYRGVGSGAKAVLTVVSVPFYVDEAVANGVTYSYVVVASNDWGDAAASDPVEASPIATPAAPTGLVAVAGDASVSLTWEAGLNNLSYNVYRRIYNGGEFETIATGLSLPSYTDATAVNGTAYVYFVSGLNGAKNSDPSNAVIATPEFPTPEAPMNLVSVAGNATVSLTWEAGLNNLSYNLYRYALTGGTPPVKIATGLTVPSYTDVAVENGTTYIYVVTGVNGTKESVYSNSADALPEFPTPEAPMNLTAVPGNATVSLTWEAGLNNLSYNLYRYALTGGTPPVKIATGLTVPSYTDVAVENGTTYIYVVTGVNGTKESVYSNSADALPDFLTPEAPVGFDAIAGNGMVSLMWTAGLNNLAYNVYRTGPSAFNEKIASNITSTSLTDISVVAGTQYTYTVTGLNGTKESAPSLPASVVVGAAPAQVTGLAATAGDAVVNLTWNASAGPVSYKVLRATGNGAFVIIADVAVAAYQDLSVANGVEYTYAIGASNSYGDAEVSASAIALPDFATPTAPSALSALAGNGSVSLSWTAGSNNGKFNVYRAAGTSAAVRIATGLTTASYTDATVVNGTEYTYSVTGTNGTKESPASNLAIALPRGEVPAQVTGLVATAGNATVSLTWVAAARATSYKVVRGTDTIATVAAASYTDNAVVNGTTYSYSVVATNVWGNAPVSTSVSAKPTAPTAGLKAQYKAGNVAASTNGIRPLLQIVNTGTTSVALSQVTVRYWFTNDGSQGATYWCDWAQIGQTNLTGTVKTVSPARTGADRYLEIAFKTTAGNLAAGASTGEIQSRFSKSDWSNYTQTNDASYDPTKATSYVDWNRVTVYVNGTLVWGLEP